MQLIKYALMFVFLCVNLSLTTQAEIYKWRDKNGVMRYSDTPPRNAKNIKTLKGKSLTKKSNPAKKPANAEVVAEETTVDALNEATKKEMEERQKEIERVEKQNAKAKADEVKRKQMNCRAAKANYQSFMQGGRVYKTNANGEREYLDDDALAEGAAKAQRQISENCS